MAAWWSAYRSSAPCRTAAGAPPTRLDTNIFCVTESNTPAKIIYRPAGLRCYPPGAARATAWNHRPRVLPPCCRFVRRTDASRLFCTLAWLHSVVAVVRTYLSIATYRISGKVSCRCAGDGWSDPALPPCAKCCPYALAWTSCVCRGCGKRCRVREPRYGSVGLGDVGHRCQQFVAVFVKHSAPRRWVSQPLQPAQQ